LKRKVIANNKKIQRSLKVKKFLRLLLFGGLVPPAVLLTARVVEWGTSLPTFSTAKFMAFYVPFLAFLAVLVTRRDPLSFLLLALVVLLPVLGFKVPPARLRVTGVDIFSLAITSLVLYRKFVQRSPLTLVPHSILLVSIAAFIPSVALSIQPAISLVCLARLASYYFLFVALYWYFGEPSWRRKFLLSLAACVLLVSLSVIAERAAGVNLSLGYHPGKISESGLLIIRRYSGFFQDPQKAAQFISCLSAFLAVLVSRRVIRGWFASLLSWAAVIVSVPAVLITESRASILVGLPVIVGAPIFFSRLKLAPRIAVSSAAVALILFFVAIYPIHVSCGGQFVRAIRARLERSGYDLSVRIRIWRGSWHIFQKRPIVGIGLGTYQEYLMRENPKLRAFHKQGGFVPNMPESGYLKVLYEGGIIGAMGCVGLIGSTVFLFLGMLRINWNTAVADMAWAALFGLLIFLVTFTTIFTISDPRNAIVPVILLLPIFYFKRREPANARCWEVAFDAV